MYWADYFHASISGRRMGKTTAIINAAKSINATVLVATEQQARQLRLEHGPDVKICSVDANTRGSSTPFLWDNTAVEHILSKYNAIVSNQQRALEQGRINEVKDERERLKLSVLLETICWKYSKIPLWVRWWWVERFVTDKESTYE